MLSGAYDLFASAVVDADLHTVTIWAPKGSDSISHFTFSDCMSIAC